MDRILTDNIVDYKNMLCDFSECIEDLLFAINNQSYNEKYEKFQDFFKYCRYFASENRGIGTLMKQLHIDE